MNNIVNMQILAYIINIIHNNKLNSYILLYSCLPDIFNKGYISTR